MAPILPTPPPPSLAVPSQPIAPPQSLLTRTQRFIEENQKLILLGCAVAASAGAGYYLYSRSSPPSDKPGSNETSSSSKKSKKNKKKKGGNEKFLGGEGTEGPLLEELPSKKSEQTVEQPKPAEKTILDEIPDAAGLAAMSEADRNAMGVKLKDRGNQLYSKKHFADAVECYTRAIEVSVKRDSVFFSNRAACYGNYSPPEYEKVVADCDEALKLDRVYTKAMRRRATALEHLGREEEAIRDFHAVTILENFKDEAAMQSLDRCLQNLAQKRAKEVIAYREPRLPSPTFISSYLAAFRPHPKPTLPESPSQGDQTLNLAFDALSAADYAHANTFISEAIDQGISTTDGQAEAYNLRGTFKFLIGDSIGAKDDLDKSIELKANFVQSWVKLASVHMELGDAASAFGDFEAAIRHDATNPDIYYHRGQVYFIMQEFDKALADYEHSTKLDDTFIFTHIQRAVAQYKMGNIAPSMAAFRRILKDFPDRGEPSNYYGEILMDQQKFSESIERFDKALDLDKNKKPKNVLPLVNKALAMIQWKKDYASATSLCKEALQLDPECDVAVATLAQLSLQQSEIDESLQWLEKSVKLARSEPEVMHALQFELASKAQKAFTENYPEQAERLAQLGSSM